VARIETPQQKHSGEKSLRLTLHKKYYEGWRRGSPPAEACGQEVVVLTDDKLCDATEAARVESWIATAATYSSHEKRFVDDLIAKNPNVIDMEMGLPGDNRVLNKNGKKVAPRMDLVTVVTEKGSPCLNFWEAKCADNSELRAEAEIDVEAGTGAKVARQLSKYTEWLRLAGHADEVALGYQNAGQHLHEIAKIFRANIDCLAVRAWAKLAKEKPTLFFDPGLVIGNYLPGADNAIYASVKSFERHRLRLNNLRVTLVEVARPEDGHLSDRPFA
jgi:hypothetical protein